jgi:hypothetical protein
VVDSASKRATSGKQFLLKAVEELREASKAINDLLLLGAIDAEKAMEVTK